MKKVVAAIILHEDGVFVTQCGYGDFKGGFDFPGKIEAGESPKEALMRERWLPADLGLISKIRKLM